MVRYFCCFFLGFFILSLLLLTKCIGQNKPGWKIQQTSLRTKWADDVRQNSSIDEYPRPQMRREKWQNLNGIWNYAITDRNSNMPSHFKGEILVPYPIESALSGVKRQLLPTQVLWYKRRFFISNDYNQRVILHFGAVDWQASVFVNGKDVGSHTGGYTAFSCDITEALEKDSNELIVKVFDPTDQGIGPHGKQALNPINIYYTASSGIWQTVWIEKVGINHIKSLRINPDINNSAVNVVVLGSSVDCLVEVTAKQGKKVVANVEGKVNQNIVLPIRNVKLWSPETPFLYDLEVKLKKRDSIVDNIESYFGMRNVTIQKDVDGFERIFLNNKPYYNLGALDQGFWPEGLYTAPTDKALAFDIALIKAMGFNTIRKHIKVEPARWYFHADKIGILVWQDFVNPNQGLPDGSRNEFEKQVKETIDQLYNYPCITTWVVFNEKWGQYDQKRITEWVKKYDFSRLVNGHSGELLYVNDKLRSPSPNAYEGSDMTDVHSYLYPRMPPYLTGKVRVLGEYGGAGAAVQGHLWDDLAKGWGYDSINNLKSLRNKYSAMVDSLVVLKKEGLSASIYTQPFDVESEQNGLITYDRKIVKIPFDTIQAINKRLVIQDNNNWIGKVKLSLTTAREDERSYEELLTEYKKGRRDSFFLRSLAILAQLNGNKIDAKELSDEYLRLVKNPLDQSNLKFIIKFTKSTDDIGFWILYNNMLSVNHILGKDQAEAILTGIIENRHVTPFVSNNNVPKWDDILQTVKRKYGKLGEETVLQAQVLYAVDHKDWNLFKTCAPRWFDEYGSNRFWVGNDLLNNIAWSAFEHSLDRDVLETALKMSKKTLQIDQPALRIDTYANILYKLGRIKDAIMWEEKAVESKKGADDEAIYIEILNKMKNGKATWN